MNNRCAFIFALLTKLTVSPQFLLLGRLHDTENIFFFFQTRLCNKAENYSLFKVNSYEFMSSNVLIHFFFFLILMVRYVVGSFDPRPQLSGPRFVSSCGSLLLATVSTLAFFIPFLFIFIVSSGNTFFLTGIWNTISHISKLLWGKVTDSWPPVIPHVTIMYGW